jgi:hypothetical protein
MNQAFVFQHTFTGVQIFVYHAKDEQQAKRELNLVVKDGNNWVYLCKKVVQEI